jgi:hypothetical protein
LTELYDDLAAENVGGTEAITPEKLLFIWYMVNEGESMRIGSEGSLALG